MIEFLIKHFSNFTLGVEVLAAVTGLVLYKKYKHTAAKYFIMFLVYIVFIVLFGRYSHYVRNDGPLSFLDNTLFERNYWWYTLVWKIGAVAFFSWYYGKVLENNFHKRILKYTTLVFFIISFCSIILDLNKFFTGGIPIISITGGLIILQCVFYYFIEILQSERILNFYKSLNFYISCAILIFWLIKTPLVFYEQYYRLLDEEYIYLRNTINLVVIFFMYITYTVGLIVSKPEYD